MDWGWVWGAEYMNHFGMESGPEPSGPKPSGRVPEDPGHLLRALLDAIPYPIFYKDQEGRFLGCNLAFETSRNLTRDELIGKTVFDLLPLEEARRMDGKDRELLRAGTCEMFLDAVSQPRGESGRSSSPRRATPWGTAPWGASSPRSWT